MPAIAFILPVRCFISKMQRARQAARSGAAQRSVAREEKRQRRSDYFS